MDGFFMFWKFDFVFYLNKYKDLVKNSEYNNQLSKVLIHP